MQLVFDSASDYLMTPFRLLWNLLVVSVNTVVLLMTHLVMLASMLLQSASEAGESTDQGCHRKLTFFKLNHSSLNDVTKQSGRYDCPMCKNADGEAIPVHYALTPVPKTNLFFIMISLCQGSCAENALKEYTVEPNIIKPATDGSDICDQNEGYRNPRQQCFSDTKDVSVMCGSAFTVGYSKLILTLCTVMGILLTIVFL